MEKCVKVNKQAKAAVATLLNDLFFSIAFLDPDTVIHNLEQGTDSGMPVEDRLFPSDLADFLTDHLATIILGLISNDDFREVFIKAVSIEMELENKEEALVNKLRKEMSGDGEGRSDNDLLVDFSIYNESIYREIAGRSADSFRKMHEYDDSFDDFICKLGEEERMDIGYCVSNFMYLLRAFAKNNTFTSYVTSVVNEVEETLRIY